MWSSRRLWNRRASISDVAIPLAVLPRLATCPLWRKFETHRDSGGDTLEDLVAVEITDLTVDKYGWVRARRTEIQLAQDPPTVLLTTLSEVWYTIVPMDLGAARLGENHRFRSDVDFFWGFDVNGDGLPPGSGNTADATGTAFEYLSEWGFLLSSMMSGFLCRTGRVPARQRMLLPSPSVWFRTNPLTRRT